MPDKFTLYWREVQGPSHYVDVVVAWTRLRSNGNSYKFKNVGILPSTWSLVDFRSLRETIEWP